MTIEEIKAEMRSKKKIQQPKHSNKVVRYISKVFIIIVLTLTLLIVLKSNKSFKESFYEKVYDTNFSFAKINKMYQDRFGSPIPFIDLIESKTEKVFSEKLEYHETETYEEGVKLTVDKDYLIPVIDSGMIVFIGEKENYGNTIIVQQVDGIDVWYSNIKTVSVNLYDYIEAGELLGEVNDDYLILVYKKDGKVLNYEEYLKN